MNPSFSPPLVSLLGAGPGDPELLTLRAARRLAAAEVIFYDALANPEILSLAPDDCQRIDVGKRGGRPSTAQLLIHEQMIRAARQGQRVVRLKGGDPFLFGRGSEECLALRAAGIAYEIVPGITSAMGAAAYAGIPLTHRQMSRSVLFCTGQQARNSPPIDWSRFAQAADTLVIYMGISQITQICAGLLAGGMSPSTPATAIQWATLEQRQVRSTVQELPIAIARVGIASPAVLIIGAVVELGDVLAWRPAAQESGLAQQAGCR
ncbi:uroporphyrinogen-III C-methyltransferase [Acidithiobacillus sp. AMEEHan]|uniref:uroporphyrinogen-III C-methyltransferase n=1 Tax=Acidithiobacillus sp. AMEEHan TaxID=2994951 RepID=UPI0027E54A4B|nr:uroporphyrinogen-III C-methyltransferase [Acidithiobacillus sp. AMEEHan]